MRRNVSYISHKGISGGRKRGYVPTEEPFRARGAHRKSHQCAIKSARVTARRRVVSALRRLPIIPRFRKDYTVHANVHVSRNARASFCLLSSRSERASPKRSSLSHIYMRPRRLCSLPSRKRQLLPVPAYLLQNIYCKNYKTVKRIKYMDAGRFE